MPQLNPHFLSLPESYIFPLIERKLEEVRRTPGERLLNLGIGDVALPLAPSIGGAIRQATLSMERAESMRGYGPSTGYPFLKEVIASTVYAGLSIEPDEIFISDGINSDIVHIFNLFDLSCRVALPNPAYPAYRNAILLQGRGGGLVELPCTEETGFLPRPPAQPCDLIILCSPHNPTGAALTREELASWVAYARAHEALLLYDSAYAGFVTSQEVPRSIFEIEGARDVAIEFCSFSKSAGFTGLRCSYTVLPRTVTGLLGGARTSLHPLWTRRQQIKFNGVAYPIQCGAAAALQGEGLLESRAQVASYLRQAERLREGVRARGFSCYGGRDCPYLWWKVPEGFSSWNFFEHLLERLRLLSIPGEGFGSLGQGYVRLSSFVTEETADRALERLAHL